jgi:hypothetical protein
VSPRPAAPSINLIRCTDRLSRHCVVERWDCAADAARFDIAAMHILALAEAFEKPGSLERAVQRLSVALSSIIGHGEPVQLGAHSRQAARQRSLRGA